MFFKKKEEKKLKPKVIMITIDLINHATYDKTSFVWYFKDLDRFEEYRNRLTEFCSNYTKTYLEIQEEGDYMYFRVPLGLDIYFAGCEIVDDFDEEN